MQGTLRENQGVLLSIYTVYNAAHLVPMLGHTLIRCALAAKTTVVLGAYGTTPRDPSLPLVESTKPGQMVHNSNTGRATD